MNYNFLSFLISWIFPTQDDRRAFRKFCDTVEINQSVPKLQKHYEKLVKKLRKDVKKKRIRVLFLVNEIAKWKCQSLYDLMAKSENFEPIIALTISDVQNDLAPEIHNQILKDNYNFFKSKSMNVEYAFDIKKDKAINLKRFNPDMVFYQQPYYLDKKQDIKKVYKYALTYYIPYYVNNFGILSLDYSNFHKYLYRYYVANRLWEAFYKKHTNARNIKGLGHPKLDTYYLNHDIQNDKHCVIYAPHWSIHHPKNKNDEYFSTFDWSGKIMLEYAKKHQEINWLFKPHPTLKTALKKIGWSDAEINNYYDEWKNIGTTYFGADYLDMFMQSDAMITDCASFLIEYFYAGKPLIHLVSKYNTNVPPEHMEPVFDTFYDVHNKDELCKTLDSILIEKDDYKKDEREKILNSKDFKLQYAAKNIIEDIKREVGLIQ